MPIEDAVPNEAPEVSWQPSQRYPDSAVQIIDQSFARYRLNLAAVERIAHGFRWSEGPVWFGDGRYLLWSDIPNNRIMKWEEETGAVSIFRRPSNFANGNTRDRQALVTCEHGGRPSPAPMTARPVLAALRCKTFNRPDVVVSRISIGVPSTVDCSAIRSVLAKQNAMSVPRRRRKREMAALECDVEVPKEWAFIRTNRHCIGRVRTTRARVCYDGVGGRKLPQAQVVDVGTGTLTGCARRDGNVWMGGKGNAED